MTTLNPPKSPPNKASVVRGLIAELLTGKWNGGDRLTEKETCQRFRVSRTPVREAFFELQGLGLIELRRNCGAVALPFGPQELSDIYAVRRLLEVEASRLAAPNVDGETLATLRSQFERIRKSSGKDPDWRHDRELHQAIAKASGNPRLASEIDRYANLVQTIREIVGSRALGIHTTTADDHLAILEALEKLDPEAAGRAMADHLRQASESAVRAVKEIRGGRSRRSASRRS